MKLLVLVLALSCVVAYTAAKRRGQYWPTNTRIFTIPHRFRREADSQGSIVAKGYSKDTPQLSFDNNENLHLVLFDDEHITDDLGKDDNVVPGSESPNAQLHSIHQIDENDYLSAYTFHPGAYGGFAENLGTGGGFRWRREADRHVEPRFRFEAEKNLGKNSFVTGFVDLQRGANGRGLEPTVGATAGIRFRREADQIEEIEDETAETY